MSKSIIKVQFPDKYRDGEFGKQEYTYYLDAGLTVAEGDIINVPTKFGYSRARVSQINLPDGVIDERWAKDVRTINAADLAAEPRDERPKASAKNGEQAFLESASDAFFFDI